MTLNAATLDEAWRAELPPEETRLVHALDACGVTFHCNAEAGGSAFLQALDVDGVPLAQVSLTPEADKGPVSVLLGTALARLDLVL